RRHPGHPGRGGPCDLRRDGAAVPPLVKSSGRALRWIRQAGIAHSDEVPGGILRNARRIDCGVCESQAEIFREQGVLEGRSQLYVMNALDVGQIAAQAYVRQLALLSGCLGNVCKRICAWVVVELVVAREEAD